MARRQIAVVGAGACDEHTAALAHEVGRRLAEAGCTLVTGGLGGVMEAASRGASEAGGLVVGLLPGDRRESANRWVAVALPTGLGEARNALVASAGEALIAIAGEYGTLSEIALALRRGTRVVSLGSWHAGLDVVPAETPAEAVRLALEDG